MTLVIDWAEVYRNGCPPADLRQAQEPVTITCHTAELALSALNKSQEHDAYDHVEAAHQELKTALFGRVE